jgi:hypothetical protein
MSGHVAQSPVDYTVSPLAQIAISSDTAKSDAAGTVTLAVDHYYGGAAPDPACNSPSQCSHFGLWVWLDQTAPTHGLSFDTAVFANVRLRVAGDTSGSGSSPPQLQGAFGFGCQVSDEGGGHYGSTCGEFDLAITGLGTIRKEGISITSVPLFAGNDSQLGIYSAALGIWAGGTCGLGSGAGGSACAGYRMGISFGRDDSFLPIDSNGTLIGVTQSAIAGATYNVTNGIDFSRLTIANCSFAAGGLCLQGNGNIKIENGSPTIRLTDTASVDVERSHRFGSVGLPADQIAWQINKSAGDTFAASVNAFLITKYGDFVVGAGLGTNMATNATGQFLGLPTSAGTPVGVPAYAGPGFAPIEVDTTNNKLCYYNYPTTAWRCL